MAIYWLKMRFRQQSAYYLLGIILLGLTSCYEGLVCPAYQSYFILDDTTRYNTFSYMEAERDTPKTFRDVRQTADGIIDRRFYDNFIAHNTLRTIPMEVIMPQKDDSLALLGDALMFAEMDIVDSASVDSAVVSGPVYPYNNDQKYYNWYFREKLVWADEVNYGISTGPQTNNTRTKGATGQEGDGFFKRTMGKVFNKDKEKKPKKVKEPEFLLVPADSTSSN